MIYQLVKMLKAVGSLIPFLGLNQIFAFIVYAFYTLAEFRIQEFFISDVRIKWLIEFGQCSGTINILSGPLLVEVVLIGRIKNCVFLQQFLISVAPIERFFIFVDGQVVVCNIYNTGYGGFVGFLSWGNLDVFKMLVVSALKVIGGAFGSIGEMRLTASNEYQEVDVVACGVAMKLFQLLNNGNSKLHSTFIVAFYIFQVSQTAG